MTATTTTTTSTTCVIQVVFAHLEDWARGIGRATGPAGRPKSYQGREQLFVGRGRFF